MPTIVCLGDSITAGYPYSKDNSWVNICREKLNISLINAGVSNHTVGDMLGRYQTDVAPHNPDAVIILAGTNDAWQEMPLTVTINNFIELMAKVKSNDAVEPIFGLPPPIIKEKVKSYYQQGNVDVFNQRLNEIRNWIKEFTRNNKVTVLDFYGPLCYPGTDQGKTDLYCDDGGHPNLKGYAMLAKSIERDLLELVKNLQVL